MKIIKSCKILFVSRSEATEPGHGWAYEQIVWSGEKSVVNFAKVRFEWR